MHRPTVFAALIATAALAPVAQAQNRLANPGFELGSLAGWAVGGPTAGSVFVGTAGAPIEGHDVAAFGPAVAVPRDGAYAASGIVRGGCCAPPEGFTLTQVLSLEPGRTYSVGLSLANAGTAGVFGVTLGGNQPEATDIFVNGTSLIGSSTRNVAAGEWLDLSSSFVAGAGPTTVTFQIVASGTAFAPVSVDALFVTGPAVVPEPATLTLLGVGLLGVLAVARRRVAPSGGAA